MALRRGRPDWDAGANSVAMTSGPGERRRTSPPGRPATPSRYDGRLYRACCLAGRTATDARHQYFGRGLHRTPVRLRRSAWDAVSASVAGDAEGTEHHAQYSPRAARAAGGGTDAAATSRGPHHGALASLRARPGLPRTTPPHTGGGRVQETPLASGPSAARCRGAWVVATRASPQTPLCRLLTGVQRCNQLRGAARTPTGAASGISGYEPSTHQGPTGPWDPDSFSRRRGWPLAESERTPFDEAEPRRAFQTASGRGREWTRRKRCWAGCG